MHFWFCKFTGMKMSSMEDAPSHVNALGYISPYTSLHNQVSGFCGCHTPQTRSNVKKAWFYTILLHSQVPGYMVSQDRRDWREYSPAEQQPLPPPHHPGSHAELQYGQCHYPSPISRAWPGSHTENGKLQYTHNDEYNILNTFTH